ncbi:hypothetical protein AXF42_Ash003569 [Apostasia shenzhenica]|uniref:DUF3741 domain-containing protein n=1 Tax=Apostasia shenzhenica TaxID=1088818 RepID=A0A2I0BGL6_9ASPA|nr:hypothetical protein AXF42_Ash003569 [Apostasia shenzhenica]
MKLAVHTSLRLGTDGGSNDGCITGVLRRIFSGKGVKVGEKRPAVKPQETSPGIVARLMGLQSMPVCPYFSPETISRTGCGAELQPSESFWEVPMYLRKESEEFLVLSFGEDEENGMMQTKAEGRTGEKIRSRRRNSQNPAELTVSCRKKLSSSPGDIELNCGSSEDWSPVSVLHLPRESLVNILPEEDEPRTKKVLRDSGKPKANLAGPNSEDREALRSGEVERKKVCRYGGDDLNSSSRIVTNFLKTEEAQGIGCAIGLQIFEDLLIEAAVEMWDYIIEYIKKKNKKIQNNKINFNGKLHQKS